MFLRMPSFVDQVRIPTGGAGTAGPVGGAVLTAWRESNGTFRWMPEKQSSWATSGIISGDRRLSLAWRGARGDNFRQAAQRLGARNHTNQPEFLLIVYHRNIADFAGQQSGKCGRQFLRRGKAGWGRPHDIERDHSAEFLMRA